MEKLVIVYFAGSEWEGCDVALPFEYESKGQAELDILIAWQKYIELNKIYIDETSKIRTAAHSPGFSTEEDFSTKLNMEYKHLEKLRPDYNFMLGEQEICLLDFTSQSFNGDKKVEYSGPQIYTLEEWFETFKKG